MYIHTIYMLYRYTMENYSSINIKSFHFDNMDGSEVYYAKWNKSEKGRYYMTSPTCGIYKDKETKQNKTKQKQTHRHKEQIGDCHEGLVGGSEQNK